MGVPPFMTFRFDESLELRSDMPRERLEKRALRFAKTCGICGPHGQQLQTSNALEAIGGPILPSLLARDVGHFGRVGPNFGALDGPHVTVRYIKSMLPQPAIRWLFKTDEQQLLRSP